MKLSKKAKRLMAARALHLGCNAMDSTRVLTWYYVIGDRSLSNKERRLLGQRYDKSKEMVDDVRKLANRLERTAKA